MLCIDPKLARAGVSRSVSSDRERGSGAMGEDFAGQKRQQDMFQYSMAASLAAALLSGWYYQSMRTGWQAYLAGLFFTWLINIVEWSYWFPESKSWMDGKFLDATGYWELERMEALIYAAAAKQQQQQHQITLNGGPARMTISSKPPSPVHRFKKW